MAGLPSDIRTIVARTLAAGLTVALVSGGVVWAVARARLGGDDQAAMARIEADAQARVSASEDTLVDLTARVAGDRSLIRSAARTPDSAQHLFDLLDNALPAGTGAIAGVTVYDASEAPLAWAGRVMDLPRGRLDLAPAVFITPDALGPRLVRIEPIIDRSRPGVTERLGSIVAETLLTNVSTIAGVTVTLTPGAAAGARTSYAFPVRSTGGAVLAAAQVTPADLAAARSRWTRIGGASMVGALGLTLIACIAPLMELRRRVRERRRLVALVSLSVFVLVIVAGSIASLALGAVLTPETAAPYRLLANALTLAALVWLALDVAERRRLGRPSLQISGGLTAGLWTTGIYFAAGAADAAIIWGYEDFLRRFVNATGLDLLHFSLHPLNASRAAISFSLVLLHAGIIWGGALMLRLAAISNRRPRRTWADGLAAIAAAAGAAAGVIVVSRFSGPVPTVPAVVALLTTAVCAAALARPRGALRRASQGARLALLYLALVFPAVALYPSLEAFAMGAKARVVESTFAPQAVNLRSDLQRQSDRALEQIDAMPDLPALIRERPDADTPTTEQAFSVWSRTALAEHRITSALELYGANGRPLSRFALNLPEYTAPTHIAQSCRWTTFEEVTSFAASDRHVLRATRGICTKEGMIGAIVVRVMLDYRTLPFISSQRPYVEPAAADDQVPAETTLGRDVDFTFYGWSEAPLYTSSTAVWPIPSDAFAHLVAERRPLWATTRGDDGRVYRVYLTTDRGGIYALGYPVITAFGHMVNLAELIVLTLVLWALLLGAAALFNVVSAPGAASGRALLRDVRSSFYLKLWLAFVGSTVIPVVILAFAAHTYFKNQFDASVKEDAVRTATVAQRLVEDYAALQPRQNGTLEALDDQVMILVSQAIDQDVNLFDPKHLQATSQPDFFASGVLPLRTPDDVYRAVVLDRLPTFVGKEEVGRASYLLAAARVRAGQREGIVTVPLTLRAQEADRQTDNLDREVLFASVLFVMLGAAIGYWMAERIADPVSRLTRATRRIARGDLDARIAATSSDELRRLVEDFNSMAADLQRQRSELERTQRLEAWADMARQVAHDIKNPLTPIQLSAEHARRVNMDRGRPLSPVLDECVGAILTQVKLLRQIAAEFSSFASSPTARPEPTDLPALINEVIDPYRAGLAGRVAITMETDPELPAALIDRTLFARGLTNLIENALFAMPGGGTLTVRTSRRDAGPMARLTVTVSDTGTGMDEEALKRLFEPYFSTKASGTGLGLTIAKRNVELNGGTIQVASQRGVGTTITITLPTA